MGHLAGRGALDDTALRQATVMGSVMASYDVEDFGTGRYDTLTRNDLRTRLKDFKHLMDPQPIDNLI